ncbi:Tfp pilus assembly protein PilF [Pricia antarctica]|uniref:Tfp pilus assembly protein PilF n=1 Tax=Pricia antarctica TaxID=641691 RepID=A0A1G6Z1V2_9FLAO|nr:tetratricopeptide repeat protein [Pricia antarctica]SDD96521.1 Tfp pilus assembly protein PilF [Pricia antarctica]
MRSLLLIFVGSIIFRIDAQAPPDAKGYLKIADSLYATGNYNKAINYYAETGGENSGLQIARAYNAIGNLEKAIVQYQSVIGQHPDWQIPRFELGKLLLKAKAYDEARKLFSQLTASGNDNPEYHYYLGETFQELDQPASALVAYKSAIELDSNHLRSLFQLGKYFTIKLERDQALRYVDVGLRFYKNDVSLINLKALIYYNDNQYKTAIPWFERLLELGENKPYVYEKLGYCYYKNWEFEKAKETYRILIGIDDQNSDTYFGMAETLWKNKQLDSAEIYINKAMNIQRPIFAKGYGSLASFARERNNLKSALAYYKLAYKEAPSDEMLYFNICTVADQLFKDPKMKLGYYENFIKKFGANRPYASKTATKRIKELKEEIHFAKN